METPAQTAVRLLTALEDFTAQETVLLLTDEAAAAASVQERAAPLVEKLSGLAADPTVQALRPRVAALLERRQQNCHFRDIQLARLQSELRHVDEARSRLAQVAPAYRDGNAAVVRLNAAA